MKPAELLDDGAMGVDAAKRFTGLGRTALYDLMNRRILPFTKVGSRRLIPKRALIQVLANNLTSQSENQPCDGGKTSESL